MHYFDVYGRVFVAQAAHRDLDKLKHGVISRESCSTSMLESTLVRAPRVSKILATDMASSKRVTTTIPWQTSWSTLILKDHVVAECSVLSKAVYQADVDRSPDCIMHKAPG